MQRSALCRSRRELSNEYLLAKIGVDTAENEPLEVWGKIIQYYLFVSLMRIPAKLPNESHPALPLLARLAAQDKCASFAGYLKAQVPFLVMTREKHSPKKML